MIRQIIEEDEVEKLETRTKAFEQGLSEGRHSTMLKILAYREQGVDIVAEYEDYLKNSQQAP